MNQAAAQTVAEEAHDARHAAFLVGAEQPGTLPEGLPKPELLDSDLDNATVKVGFLNYPLVGLDTVVTVEAGISCTHDGYFACDEVGVEVTQQVGRDLVAVAHDFTPEQHRALSRAAVHIAENKVIAKWNEDRL